MRKAQSAWFTTHKWLRYSVSCDGVFCSSCFLFGTQDPKSKALSKSPVSDWSNIKKIVDRHGESDYHMQQGIAAENFVAVMRGQRKDIECCVSSQYNTVVERNRQILADIVETLILCGKQNIALRGHEESSGNFQALLHFQAKNNAVLKRHLTEGDPRTKYISPKIQNELIEICGKIISDELVKSCNDAGIFGFMADEATDSATLEQMSLCLRFVDRDSSDVREEFIGFAECERTTGESLAKSFLENLTKLGKHKTLCILNGMP